MDTLRVAVFGCGLHGRSCHLTHYASLPDVEIVATVDADADRARFAAEEFGAGAWFTDHREALEQTRPDLVSVVSPPAFHCRQTLDAFEAGAHVLCEKPLAMNVTEARQMVAAAANAGKFLSMGLQSRHTEAGRRLRKRLAENVIGDVFFTRVWCGHILNIPGWGHFHHKSLAGGGVVMATTVHILDFALWALGNPQPQSVTSFMHAKLARMREPAITWEGPPEECDIEDFAHAVIRFENGSWMSVESDWLKHPSDRPTGVEFLGNDGRAWLHPLKIEVDHQTKIEDVTPEFEENPNPTRSFLVEAVERARDGGETIVRPDQIIQVQAVMDAMYRSAETGREEPVPNKG